MKQNTNQILKEELERITPSKEELTKIKKLLEELVKKINENIRKKKINADVFVGGSYAKGTLIRKEKYDVDIFVRFEDQYEDKKISPMLKKLLPPTAKEIHGSRDYFSLKQENIEFEIIPVMKVKKPESAKNITDLSYFHVNYVRRKIMKNPRLAGEIKLAKAFAHFQDCYGAESYINGFSGYALELLIIHYGSFLNFVKNVIKTTDKKCVIDQEKLYKNKEAILREVNESKLSSPIVLIDPTFKERNALAALSQGSFNRFKDACKRFLKHPSFEFFKKKDNIGLLSKKYKHSLIKIVLKTDRQAGDIAGTKLKKFYNFFLKKIERYFLIKESYFEYDETQNIGGVFLVLNPRKEIIFQGPLISMKDRLAEFKREHKKFFVKNRKAFAAEKGYKYFKDFLEDFLNKNQKTIEEMSVSFL